MTFTLDAKALFKELGIGPGGLERTLTTQKIVEIFTQRGLKVLGIYGSKASIKAENGRLYLPVNGRVVEIEIPLQQKPIASGKYYQPYAERIDEPFIDS